MNPFELPHEVVDEAAYKRTAAHLSKHALALPRFADMIDPKEGYADGVDPDAPDGRNLFRVHWYNDPVLIGGLKVPCHVELPTALTGVSARILVMLGNRFPIIRAHKVLAAYACLAPRLVTGAFDPTRQRAIWPSTGNYCRGGVAISRMLGCHGVAVLPEGMSAERFEWLERWVAEPGDIVRTPGTESNVKEIYDACNELSRDPNNVVFNQFSEFPNYLAHYTATGTAAGRLYEAYRESSADLRLGAFVAATGSAGTLAAGDRLKQDYGARIVAVEPTECPTLLYNGFGEHNIQGIGDKHVPLIHNVMNTDLIVGVTDDASDDLNVLFNSETGRRYLVDRRRLDPDIVAALSGIGLSGIANIMASIKVARRLGLDADDAIVTVATDGSELYATERERRLADRYGGTFDEVAAAETFGQHLLGGESDHTLELAHRDRERVFNLGYYTWVEQQGVSVEDFIRRRHQGFWRGLRDMLPVFDGLIDKMNHDSGMGRVV